MGSIIGQKIGGSERPVAHTQQTLTEVLPLPPPPGICVAYKLQAISVHKKTQSVITWIYTQLLGDKELHMKMEHQLNKFKKLKSALRSFNELCV